MKKNNLKLIGVIFVSLVVIGLAYFFLAVYQPGAGMYVKADMISEQPEKYVEFTPEKLKNYPYIMKQYQIPER
jgi:Na+/H+-dicarboxylate symporter